MAAGAGVLLVTCPLAATPTPTVAPVTQTPVSTLAPGPIADLFKGDEYIKTIHDNGEL